MTPATDDLLCLNLGCGDFPFPRPYVNIDIDTSIDRSTEDWQDAIFQYHDLRDGIPFADGSCGELNVSNLLCQFEQDQAIWLLRECARVLAPGGHLAVIDHFDSYAEDPNHLLHPARLEFFLREKLGLAACEMRTDTDLEDPEAPMFVCAPECEDHRYLSLVGFMATKPVEAADA